LRPGVAALHVEREGVSGMQTTDMRMAVLLAGVSAIGFAGQRAEAVIVLGNGDAVSVTDLFAEGSDRMVVIEDKLFTFESFTSSTFKKGDFSIVGFVSQNPNQFGLYNVGFDLFGPMGDATPGNGQASELNLQYTVAVLEDAYRQGVRLCDTRLTFNGAAGGNGSYSRVDESVFDLDENLFLGQLSVYNLAGPPSESRLTDYIDFCESNPDGFRALEVNKDFKFFSPTAEGTASASFIRQEFSQIPAPGAVALLGLAGVFGSRRRCA
jgi:hypothetical protein